MHTSNRMCRPLNKNFLPMLGSPLISLCFPMPRVHIKPSHTIPTHNLINSSHNLTTRNLATPLSRVPYCRPRIRAIRGSETVPVLCFQTYSSPVIRQRPVHTTSNLGTIRHHYRISLVIPLMLFQSPARTTNQPILKKPFSILWFSHPHVRALSLNVINIDMIRTSINILTKLATLTAIPERHRLPIRLTQRHISITPILKNIS